MLISSFHFTFSIIFFGENFKGIEIKNNEMHPKVRGYFLKSVDKKYVSGGKLTKLADLDKDE